MRYQSGDFGLLNPPTETAKAHLEFEDLFQTRKLTSSLTFGGQLQVGCSATALGVDESVTKSNDDLRRD